MYLSHVLCDIFVRVLKESVQCYILYITSKSQNMYLTLKYEKKMLFMIFSVHCLKVLCTSMIYLVHI